MYTEVKMQRTTIMLPHDLKIRAEEVSRKKGVPLGELIREGLKELLNKNEEAVGDLFFKDTAVYKGQTPKDLSSAHDDYLYGDKK
jgi:hypothetical protein